MTSARSIVIVLATLAAASVIACGAKRVAGPSRPGKDVDLIVLLPDSESGSTGRARVWNQSGSVDLDAQRDATRVAENRPPGPISTLSEADVQRIFGDALSALPPAPRRFTLYFRFESDALTDESRALVPEIRTTVKERLVPDVAVVGHTDTTGAPEANFKLGLERAMTIRNLLVGAGLDAASIEVTSHGEAELLIPTADQTLEPRNRRVEITVR